MVVASLSLPHRAPRRPARRLRAPNFARRAKALKRPLHHRARDAPTPAPTAPARPTRRDKRVEMIYIDFIRIVALARVASTSTDARIPPRIAHDEWRARLPPRALEVAKSINTHHVLPLKELLGHDRGQTADKVPLSVNHNNLRSHRAYRRGVVVSHSSSRMRIVTLFVHRRMIRPMRWARRRERAISPAWTPSGEMKMVGSIARRRARSMAVVPCPSYSDVASQRGGVGRATNAFSPKLVASPM